MKRHGFGALAPVSTLTLVGGLRMRWGEITTEQCIATVRAAVVGGIDLRDLAPRYGDGKAFGGRLTPKLRLDGFGHAMSGCIQMIGDDGRLGWQKTVGYRQRSHAETAMFR